MPTLNRPTFDAVAWGVVGGLSFLVLVAGYELATGFRVGLAAKVSVAFVVTISAAVASALIASRLRENERA